MGAKEMESQAPDRRHRTRIFYAAVFLFVGLLVFMSAQVDETHLPLLELQSEDGVHLHAVSDIKFNMLVFELVYKLLKGK